MTKKGRINQITHQAAYIFRKMLANPFINPKVQILDLSSFKKPIFPAIVRSVPAK